MGAQRVSDLERLLLIVEREKEAFSPLSWRETVIHRTAAVCLALTASLCTAQDALPLPALEAQPIESLSGDPVLLPSSDLTLPTVSAPPVDAQPIAAPSAPLVTDIAVDPSLVEGVPLVLIGNDSRDGRTQSQLTFASGDKPGQIRVQRQVTLPDGSVAIQEGVGKVRGDRVRVKLDSEQGLSDLLSAQPLEPVDLNLKLNRATNVVTAEGICDTHEFTAQGTDSGELAPLLDANQSRPRTLWGKIKARFKSLTAKVRTMAFGMRAKYSAWRAKRAAKKAENATRDAARYRADAQRFAAKAQGPQALPAAEPVTIQRPEVADPVPPVQAGPAQAGPIEVPAHGAQQGLPQVDAPLAATTVEQLQPRAKPVKQGNIFSRMWRKIFKKGDR